MKYSLILSLGLLAAVSTAPALNAAVTSTSYEFSKDSPLASGKWVKISVDETGLHEITYDQLREMGFSDPSKVAMFGVGGEILNWNFIDINTGKRLVEDSFIPTRILHSNDKLFFYASGTENMYVQPTGYLSTRRLKYERLSKNIYSDRSYYMLTDSQPVETVPAHGVSSKDDVSNVASGYAYIYHEKDLRQGGYFIGQVFWGEEIRVGEPLEYQIEVPYCIDKPAFVLVDYCAMEGQPGNFNVWLNEGISSHTLNNSISKIITITNNRESARLNVDANGIGRGKLRLSLSGGYDKVVPFAIDYWTLSYPISLALAVNDPGFTSQYIAIESQSSDKTWRHPAPAGSIVWDVTTRRSPMSLDVENGYFYHDTRNQSEMIVFNPARAQKHINDDWQPVKNQNLHALQNEAADMIIFTTENLREYADRIADLHNKYDGSRVVVVTPQEIFDEFNHGTPDATAYRLFAKMLYQHPDRRLKNVLFMGNIYKDFRNVYGVERKAEGHIGYMQPTSDLRQPKGAEGACAMEYYGSVSDYFNKTGNTLNVPVNLGVGILPISSKEEAAIAVTNIKNYLEREDFSNVTNEMMAISGEGDNHIHDFQAFGLRDIYQKVAGDNFNSEFAVGQLWTEGLGAQKAHDMTLSSLKSGKLMTSYYGHAGSGGFGGVSTYDLMNIDSKEPGFFFFAACDLCEPDNQLHGIGDLSVINTTKGLAGSICATRTVYSHENQALSENFVNAMFYDRDKKLRTSTPTIGEVFAQAKEKTVNSSKSAFWLIGDPALPLPVALGGINVSTDRSDYRGGEVMNVSGQVLDASGEKNSAYNGFATIKVFEPESEYTVAPDTYDEKTDKWTVYPKLKINDRRIASTKVEVKNGEFTGRVLLPADINSLLSTPDSLRNVKILVGAYDPKLRLGTSGRAEASLAMLGSEPSADAIHDESAPTVSATHDDLLRKLTVNATDDTSLLPGIGRGGAVSLEIDGSPVTLSADDHSHDVGVMSYTGTVSTARLAPGRHTAVLSATDMAGNRSEQLTFNFEVKEYAPLKLKSADNMVIDNLVLSLERNEGHELSLIVTDRDGKIVFDDDFSGTAGTYDLTEIPAGTYRAAVRDNSPRGAYIYSNWVEFTKID